MSTVSFSIAFAAGFLTFSSPCLLPLVPVYVSYITGISFDELKEGKKKGARGKILIHSVLFVLGFSAVFMALGASASCIGNFLIAYKTVMSRIGGAFVILFGFYFIGFFKFDFLGRERRIKFKAKGGSRPGSFLLGAAFAFAWTPCVGPVLGSILVLAATGETMREGVALLGFYSLGIAVPFIITAFLINLLLPYFAKFQKYFFTLKLLCGVLLILLGVLLVTDN
ncbi:MAG: cytochrome c biogenesis protein CcdA, partial [Candidatus Omnitrophota bacterium]|nr:cytochrome c biogenesis protein CcdA [Candidatus Omnitrophota bacterium]